MKPNTICLLDRNVISEIEQSLNGKPGKYHQKLKDLDKRGIFISPLLSILEGNESQNRTATTLHDCIHREADIVSRFFKQAKIDSSYLKQDASTISLAFIDDLKKKQDSNLSFVQTLQEAFVKQKSKEETRRQCEAALKIIKNNSKQFGDPCSLAGLATALGSEAARQVLKPIASSCKKHAFNAYADLEKISLINYMRHLSGISGHNTAYKLITFDKGLEKFAQMIRVTESRSASNDTHEVIQYVIDLDVFLNGIPSLNGMKKFKAELKNDLATSNVIV